LARIDVVEKYQGQGLFKELVTRFLDGQEGLLADTLSLENILNPALKEYALSVGFLPIPSTDPFSPTLYLTRVKS
jgi:hypothetical protein